MESKAYYKNLIEKVIEYSEANTWDDAVKEWVVDSCEEDELVSSTCICKKTGLRYLFTILNTINGNTLFPIGSSCIKKFKRDDLNKQVDIYECLFKIVNAVNNKEYISLTTEFFNRKLLEYFYDEGAFVPNKYNRFIPEDDYLFLLDMFNKKNKDSITEKQHNKIKALIVSAIIPFVFRKFELEVPKYEYKSFNNSSNYKSNEYKSSNKPKKNTGLKVRISYK